MHGSDSVNRFGAVLASSLAELESRRGEIDDLNVFPVADGDTGRNMVMTLRGLVDAIDSLRLSVGSADLTEVNRDLVVKAVARAALSSAHGNSGVILSQLIRGAARELGSGKGKKVSPYLLAKAMRGAAEQGFESTPQPREGTMLTVARDIADALEEAYPEPEWLPDDITPADQDERLAEALAIAVEAGTRSVDRGPELLDVLREKGVIDAGGYGLVVIVAGALAGIRGAGRSDLPHREAPRTPVGDSRRLERFGFCVNFTVSGSNLDPAAEADRLNGSGLGDSVLVVGDSEMVRVHIHTDDPDSARALFEASGTVENFEQEDMNEQIRDRDQRLGSGPRSHVIVVTDDPEVEALFEGDHLTVASGHSEAIVDAIGAVEAEEVILVSTSDASAGEAGKAMLGVARKAEVVDAANLAVALLVLTSMEDFDSGLGASLNADRIRTAMVATAIAGIRDSLPEEAEAGQLVAVSDGLIVARGDAGAVAGELLRSFEPGSFVMAIVDPSGPVDAEVLGVAGLELDLAQATLPDWHCVLAVES